MEDDANYRQIIGEIGAVVKSRASRTYGERRLHVVDVMEQLL